MSYRDYRSFGVFLSGSFNVKGIVVCLGWMSGCALICIKHELCVLLCVCKDERINMLCVCMCTSTCVGVNMSFFNVNACVCACVYLCWWHVDRETKGWGGPMLQYFFLPLPKSLGLCYANARKSRRFKVPRFQDFFRSFFQEQSGEVSWLSSMFGTSLLTRLCFVEIAFATIIICIS